jgi:hypothetical protein
MPIDRNKMATVVTIAEGLKKSTNIGQVKEVQRLTLEYLSVCNIFAVWALLRKVRRERDNE